MKGKTQGRLEEGPGSVDSLMAKFHTDEQSPYIWMKTTFQNMCLMVQMSPVTRGMSRSTSSIVSTQNSAASASLASPTEGWTLYKHRTNYKHNKYKHRKHKHKHQQHIASKNSAAARQASPTD